MSWSARPTSWLACPSSSARAYPPGALFDYLAAGDSLDTFLDDFPSVHREQAIALLELMSSMLEQLATLTPEPTEIVAARPPA